MAKLTPESEANFVISVMRADLAKHRDWDYNDQLDYLRRIGDEVDELGENILAPHRAPIGENRPEKDDLDYEISEELRSISDLLGSLPGALLATYPGPLRFVESGVCLKGAEARAWLYLHKYPHEYNHIHVFDYDLCLLLPDPEDSQLSTTMVERNTVAWIEPGGVREEGDVMDVLPKMYIEYKSRKENG